jgi:hypothetical protein
MRALVDDVRTAFEKENDPTIYISVLYPHSLLNSNYR